MRTRLAIVLFLGLAAPDHARTSPEISAASIPASPTLSSDRVSKSEKLGCILTVEPVSQVYRIPKITVVLTNRTDTDIYLVGSLDASDCRWRYPHCYFEVIGPDGKPALDPYGRCGNMNTLEERDFVLVPPGGRFNPYGYAFFSAHQVSPYTFRVPGKYRIRFFYSSASEAIAEWAGDGRHSVAANRRLAELFRLVPKVEVASDEVVVEVVGRGERR
jgi:hypothetical protein